MTAPPAKRRKGVAPKVPTGKPSSAKASPRQGRASARAAAHEAVRDYNRRYRGIKSGDAAPLSGKSSVTHAAAVCPLAVPALHAALLQRCAPAAVPAWKADLPSRAKL